MLASPPASQRPPPSPGPNETPAAGTAGLTQGTAASAHPFNLESSPFAGHLPIKGEQEEKTSNNHLKNMPAPLRGGLDSLASQMRSRLTYAVWKIQNDLASSTLPEVEGAYAKRFDLRNGRAAVRSSSSRPTKRSRQDAPASGSTSSGRLPPKVASAAASSSGSNSVGAMRSSPSGSSATPLTSGFSHPSAALSSTRQGRPAGRSPSVGVPPPPPLPGMSSAAPSSSSPPPSTGPPSMSFASLRGPFKGSPIATNSSPGSEPSRHRRPSDNATNHGESPSKKRQRGSQSPPPSQHGYQQPYPEPSPQRRLSSSSSAASSIPSTPALGYPPPSPREHHPSSSSPLQAYNHPLQHHPLHYQPPHPHQPPSSYATEPPLPSFYHHPNGLAYLGQHHHPHHQPGPSPSQSPSQPGYASGWPSAGGPHALPPPQPYFYPPPLPSYHPHPAQQQHHQQSPYGAYRYPHHQAPPPPAPFHHYPYPPLPGGYPVSGGAGSGPPHLPPPPIPSHGLIPSPPPPPLSATTTAAPDVDGTVSRHWEAANSGSLYHRSWDVTSTPGAAASAPSRDTMLGGGSEAVDLSKD